MAGARKRRVWLEYVRTVTDILYKERTAFIELSIKTLNSTEEKNRIQFIISSDNSRERRKVADKLHTLADKSYIFQQQSRKITETPTIPYALYQRSTTIPIGIHILYEHCFF